MQLQGWALAVTIPVVGFGRTMVGMPDFLTGLALGVALALVLWLAVLPALASARRDGG